MIAVNQYICSVTHTHTHTNKHLFLTHIHTFKCKLTFFNDLELSQYSDGLQPGQPGFDSQLEQEEERVFQKEVIEKNTTHFRYNTSYCKSYGIQDN